MVSLITNEDSARIGDIFSTQVLNNMTNLKSGLSPLIECPCRSSMIRCSPSFGQQVEPPHDFEDDHHGLLADDHHDNRELIITRDVNIFVAATESQKQLNSRLLSSPREGINKSDSLVFTIWYRYFYHWYYIHDLLDHIQLFCNDWKPWRMCEEHRSGRSKGWPFVLHSVRLFLAVLRTGF